MESFYVGAEPYRYAYTFTGVFYPLTHCQSSIPGMDLGIQRVPRQFSLVAVRNGKWTHVACRRRYGKSDSPLRCAVAVSVGLALQHTLRTFIITRVLCSHHARAHE